MIPSLPSLKVKQERRKHADKVSELLPPSSKHQNHPLHFLFLHFRFLPYNIPLLSYNIIFQFEANTTTQQASLHWQGSWFTVARLPLFKTSKSTPASTLPILLPSSFQHSPLTQVIVLLLVRPQLANEVHESLFPPTPPYQDTKTVSSFFAPHTSSFSFPTSSLHLKLTLSCCYSTDLTSPLVPSSSCRHLSIVHRMRSRLRTARFETLSLP